MPDSIARDRIIVADDHPVFREGMRRIVQGVAPAALIVEAATFEEVLVHARDGEQPDLFVLDLLFPGFDLESSVRQLRAEFSSATIILVSMIDNSRMIDRIMAAGADGFIGKSVPAREIASAVVAIRDGEMIVRRGSNGELEEEDQTPLPAMTPRQLDVLRLMAEGRSNKDIARQLKISPFTVRIHVSAVLRLLAVETRAAAAAKAVAAGL